MRLCADSGFAVEFSARAVWRAAGLTGDRAARAGVTCRGWGKDLAVVGLVCRVPSGAQLMADDEQGTSGIVPLAEEFVAQLRAITGRLEGLAGSGAQRPPVPGAFALPGALSAVQLKSIAESVAAQRRSIEALQAQLSAFDGQLAVLEQILSPLAQWSSTWAELEQRLLSMGRAPEPPKSSGGPGIPGQE